jgi:hypothetical protein
MAMRNPKRIARGVISNTAAEATAGSGHFPLTLTLSRQGRGNCTECKTEFIPPLAGEEGARREAVCRCGGLHHP